MTVWIVMRTEYVELPDGWEEYASPHKVFLDKDDADDYVLLMNQDRGNVFDPKYSYEGPFEVK